MKGGDHSVRRKRGGGRGDRRQGKTPSSSSLRGGLGIGRGGSWARDLKKAPVVVGVGDGGKNKNVLRLK